MVLLVFAIVPTGAGATSIPVVCMIDVITAISHESPSAQSCMHLARMRYTLGCFNDRDCDCVQYSFTPTLDYHGNNLFWWVCVLGLLYSLKSTDTVNTSIIL